jgi:hypothetical protein
MKRLTELIESNELPARMTNSLRECLENQKLLMECQGQGKEFWPCKREVISTCLEKVNFFEGLNVEDAAELVKDIENNAENMIAVIEEMEAAESMQMDMGVVEVDPEAEKQMLHDAVKQNGRLEDQVDLSAALAKMKFKPVFETRAPAVEEKEGEQEPEYDEEESSEYEGEEPEYEAEESSEYEGEESSESSEYGKIFQKFSNSIKYF